MSKLICPFCNHVTRYEMRGRDKIYKVSECKCNHCNMDPYKKFSVTSFKDKAIIFSIVLFHNDTHYLIHWQGTIAPPAHISLSKLNKGTIGTYNVKPYYYRDSIISINKEIEIDETDFLGSATIIMKKLLLLNTFS